MITTGRVRALSWALLLLAATLLVFAQTRGFDFITFDDNVYVTGNPTVQAGLTWAGFRWSFGAHEDNWHPLTWLSLMIDVELWGLQPGAFHLVNLAWHAASVLALFLLLLRTTGAVHRSGFAALLFAIHPLHVESVAWIAERKDVLSTFLWLATLHAYVSFANRPSFSRYALTGALFALGLMSKPMLVTLPVVLLLMDVWPLHRLGEGGRRLVLEKVPLLALSLASSVLTIVAQQRGGAFGGLIAFPLGARAANAAVSTIAYLGKTIWPGGLSVFYPYPAHVLGLRVAACVALIAVLTVAAVAARRSRPALLFGWVWYLVTLLPVIGLVQVGNQGMADRYTYVPLIGPFVALCFGLAEGSRRFRLACAVAGAIAATALGLRAHAQTAYWRDSVTLFQHALRVNADNVVAHSNLGRAYLDRGDVDAATAHAREVVRLEPAAPDGHFNLGVVLQRTGRTDEAVAAYWEAIRIAPCASSAPLNLGGVLASAGRLDEAEALFHEAVRCRPDSFVAHHNLGALLARRGALDEAIEQFEAAVRLDPTNAVARGNLERARSARLP